VTSPAGHAAEAQEGPRQLRAPAQEFRVHIGAFDGPFDLLLDLIGRRELEITELSLSAVTDEFLAHLERLGDDADLEQTSAFLVVGATLLDAKIAGLLPQGEVVDAEAIALLEARDLLFARLLQYRAYKEATHWFADALAVEATRHARPGGVEERIRLPAPPLELPIPLADFALLARAALEPKRAPTIGVDHLHGSVVSLRAQAAEVVSALRRSGTLSFLDLAGADAGRAIVVARFLAVLELYRLGALVLTQLEPLGALVVAWTAPDWDDSMLERLGGGLDG
jgi:segregation and condensation protein A